MPINELWREIQEFRAAYNANTLKPLDGWELAHEVTGLGVEYCSDNPLVFGGDQIGQMETVAELKALIEDLGGTLPESPPDGAYAGPILDALLAAAVKALLEWLTRQQQ